MLYKPEAVGSNPTSAIPMVSRCSSVVERRVSDHNFVGLFLNQARLPARSTSATSEFESRPALLTPESRTLPKLSSGFAASGPTAGLEYMGSDVREDVWVQIPPAPQDAVAELADAPEKL
jgi:hypothetical protein